MRGAPHQAGQNLPFMRRKVDFLSVKVGGFGHQTDGYPSMPKHPFRTDWRPSCDGVKTRDDLGREAFIDRVWADDIVPALSTSALVRQSSAMLCLFSSSPRLP